jgi:predicted Zn finger-like uncharacterized protein
MSEETYTRCPACTTVFRITPEQLAARGGQVRCGHCKTVFDANLHKVSFAPPAREGDPPAPVESADVTLPASEEPIADTATRVPDTLTSALPIPAVPEIWHEDPHSEVRQPRRRPTVVKGCAIALLLLLLAGQVVYHFRDALASGWPAARPLLSKLCVVAGCTIRPLRDTAMSFLAIEASDLQTDPAHGGVLVLTATLRNRAPWALAYPDLELTLSDARDNIVVRRALSPEDYAATGTDLSRGIAANAEVMVKVFIDARATTQAGYRLYMFYP